MNTYTIGFDRKSNPSEALIARERSRLMQGMQRGGSAYFCSAFALFCSSFSRLFRSFSFSFSSSRWRRASSFFFLFSSFCRRMISLNCALCSFICRISSLRCRFLSAPLTLLSCSFLASQPRFSGSSGSFFFFGSDHMRPKVTLLTSPSLLQHPRKMDNMTIKKTKYPIVQHS